MAKEEKDNSGGKGQKIEKFEKAYNPNQIVRNTEPKEERFTEAYNPSQIVDTSNSTANNSAKKPTKK